MDERWETVCLGDLAAGEQGAIAIGPFGSRMKTDAYTESGVAVIRGQNITERGHLDGDFVFVSPEFAATMGSANLKAGDIVLPHRGAIGRAAIVPEGDFLMSTSLMRIRVDPAKALADYVLHYLCSSVGRTQLLSYASTVGTPGIGQPLTSLRRISLPLPPLEQQRRISAVLGAFDDLIDTNQRLAEQCDQLAAAAWVHALDRRTLGPRISDIATVVLGGTPSRKSPELWGGDVPWLNSGKANEFRVIQASEYITDLGLSRSSTKLMPAGTTVIAITGATLGQVSRLEIAACGNQSLVGVFAADDAVNDFIYFAIKDRIEVLLQSATGGAQQHVNKANVEELQLPEFPREQLLEWHATAGPLMEATGQLLLEAMELRRARDELLPLLLSGAISVDEVSA